MIIERTGNEVIIRLPATIDPQDLQLLINNLKFKESTEKSNTLTKENLAENSNKKENELLYEMSNSSFANAWAEDEPEYSLNDIKTINPDYEGR
jgi:hypothetical protein